ncbi:MAG: hypothetical protein NTY32_14680, partial [Bacteroidia bacterium]|nr:hypothetical protein [Bacteroidia bacterium]
MTRRRLYRNIRKGGDSKQEPEKLAMVRKDVQLVKDAIQAMIRDGFLVSKNLSWFWFWLPLMWVVYPTPKLVQAIWDQQNSIKKATELVIKR